MPANPARRARIVKAASLDVVVWLIVFAMVAVAKGWGKLQKQIDEDSSESKETPPVVRPQMQRPRPQMRPMASPMARPVSPPQRTAPGTARPPVGTPAPREAWRIDPEQIRRFVEQVSGQTRPVPPPIPQPRADKVEAAGPPPTPEPAAAAPVAKTVTDETASSRTSRAVQWAEALRDKQNIRNIIISAEIIGPPKAF